MCRVCGCWKRGHSGDGCDLASILCRYDLRKGDLFVLSWTRVRRVIRGSIYSQTNYHPPTHKHNQPKDTNIVILQININGAHTSTTDATTKSQTPYHSLYITPKQHAPRATRRTLAQLRTNKRPILRSYLNKIDEVKHHHYALFANQNHTQQHTCCCLPTPMALASGGSPMFPLVVHQPASPSIWPAVQSLRRGLSTNPGATMWCVCGCS